MKALLVVFFIFIFGPSIAQANGSNCRTKESIATEYLEWKKDYQKFLSKYEDLGASEKLESSKDSMKDVLSQMRELSEKTLIPMPEKTFIHATGLLKEVEEGRMARTTALPILKSSLKTLESSMDEMMAKAQWKNPTCNLVSSTTKGKFSKHDI